MSPYVSAKFARNDKWNNDRLFATIRDLIEAGADKELSNFDITVKPKKGYEKLMAPEWAAFVESCRQPGMKAPSFEYEHPEAE